MFDLASRRRLVANEDAGTVNKSGNAEFYAPQTKILEGGTKDDIRIFEALFNGL